MFKLAAAGAAVMLGSIVLGSNALPSAAMAANISGAGATAGFLFKSAVA